MKSINLKNVISFTAVASFVLLGLLVGVHPAHATVSAGTVTTSTTADAIVGKVNANYNVHFVTNDASSTASTIIVTFPAGYSITQGTIGATAADAICNNTCAANGVISVVGGGNPAVSSVVGDSSARTVTITLAPAVMLNTGSIDFRLKLGVANATTTGTSGTFTITDNVTNEVAQSNVAGVTLTAAAPSYLAITGGASVAAGGSDELTVTAKDTYGNTVSSGDNNYTGVKSLTFTGLSLSPNNTTSTVEGSVINVAHNYTFSNGVLASPNATLVPEKVESATLDVSDGSVSSAGGHGLALTVTVGAVATLAVNQAPAITGTVDDNFSTQPWILVADAAGNPVSGQSVTASEVGGTGGALRGTLTPAASDTNGVVKFTNLGYNKTVDTFTIHFADGGVTTNSAGMGPLAPGVATTLTLGTPPAGGNAATAVLTTQPVVHVVDFYGNTVADGTSVSSTLLSGNGILRGASATTTVSGDATFTDLGYNKLDSFTIQFGSNGHTVNSEPLTVIAGAATSVNVEDASNGSGSAVGSMSLVSGATKTVYAVTRDTYGNYVGNPSTAWTITDATGGVTSTDLGATPATSVLFTSHLVGTGVIHAVDGGLTADSGVFTVTTGPIATITISSASTTITADQTETYTTVGHDAAGNTLGDETASTTFTISGGAGGSFDGNVYTPHTTGSWTVTATSLDDGAVSSTRALTVTPGAVTTVTFTQPPLSVGTVDSILTTQPIVHVVDQYGNTVANGTSVLASLGSGNGALRGTTTKLTTSGDATFTNLGYSKTDSFTIVFTTGGHAVTSSALTATFGTATKVGLSASPTSLNAGSSSVLTAAVQDQYGNTVTSDNATLITFTADGGATWNPHQVVVTAGVATSSLSDASAGTVGVGAEAPSLTIPSDVSVSFVPGGTAALTINSVTQVPHTTVLPDGTYTHGYEWVIAATLPADQSGMALQFADWTNSLAAGGNMEYYSEEIAADATGGLNHPISIGAANTYPTVVNVTGDSNSSSVGIQTNIHVLLSIPASTPAGAHSTTFMLESTSTVPV